MSDLGWDREDLSSINPGTCNYMLNLAQDEIERLRAENRELRAEVERLRAVLTRLVDCFNTTGEVPTIEIWDWIHQWALFASVNDVTEEAIRVAQDVLKEVPS